MPPKRKRNDAHQTPSAPAEVPSRRSSRRIRRNNHDDGVEGKTGDDATHQLDKLSSKEAVAQAMQTLSKMEHKLLDDAKRQRLAIEASSIRTMTAKKGVNGDGAVPMTSSKRAAEPKPKARTAEKKVKTEPDVPAGEPSSLDDEACLNTYLRNASTPVFSSRTCRISSILEHRYPLQDPTQPEHPTKNRPDNTQQPNVERGMKYIQEIGLNNARDIVKMIRWNDKYGIKFMRLSSEMFPFASHAEYGYGLSFAADVLASAGKVASDLGHRLTTHPGQFTQIGSPRKEVVSAAIRDLEYHNEMLTRLNLSHQLNRDAVMILHMGGTFGDKAATLDRFRENYSKLSVGVQQRLVLENDDVSWSVHDLLPICEELNIPLVLDFHHHNIVFDPSIREGTLDIIPLYDRIKSTWTRKGITQKMHYSEPCPPAITARDRRKHSPRVKTMPPCAPDMDLMIEAKDKEQAVFDLMRHFKLPGWDLFNNIIPYERDDEPKKALRGKASKASKGKKQENGVPPVIEHEAPEQLMAPEEIGMGGEERRVYWPEGMEEWLRPKKREMKNGSKSGVKDKEMKKVEDDA
ncbi:UV-endonuclease UVE-1 [Moelleriella libera RCEF 2490]|uniref:UV-endonuclease UVE-1 n=1 Tax=Moelleriella libera RCEF 2490 TaxID=1081109 RepID=A0A167ZNY7_9HYPO|nr:UV-endonuclease UVE-1 [Moelleriella libera RCEF 2490]